jgi:hypothetical protein
MAQAPSFTVKAPGQPFTFGGVARYAYARPIRVFGGALLFALIAGLVIAVLFAWRWAPVIGEAVSNLPASSVIRGGILEWPDDKIRLLGANQFLALTTASDESEMGAPVDFAFQFEPNHLTIRSWAGVAAIPYPKGWTIELNRAALLPLWGAWEKPATPLVLLASALGLIFSWMILAMPYALVVLFFASVLGKELSFRQAWKLSVAAQWPGAVLMAFMLALYAAGQTTFLLVCAAFLAHFLLTLTYLCFCPICLPRAGKNPFSTTKPARRSDKNPFKNRARED